MGAANIQLYFRPPRMTGSRGGGIHAINGARCQSLFVIGVEFIGRS
jgi:hypothetical protein